MKYSVEMVPEGDGQVLRITHDGEVTEYRDGGEPEDQTFWRDWSWVSIELQRAYKIGLRHGREQHHAPPPSPVPEPAGRWVPWSPERRAIVVGDRVRHYRDHDEAGTVKYVGDGLTEQDAWARFDVPAKSALNTKRLPNCWCFDVLDLWEPAPAPEQEPQPCEACGAPSTDNMRSWHTGVPLCDQCAKEPQPHAHPATDLVQSTEGTGYCAGCERETREREQGDTEGEAGRCPLWAKCPDWRAGECFVSQRGGCHECYQYREPFSWCTETPGTKCPCPAALAAAQRRER